jgi:NAD kinase
MAARFGRIVVVTRRTGLEELLARHVTAAQARFYLEHMGVPFEEVESAHRMYQAALEALVSHLPPSPRHILVDRSFLPTYAFEERDLVITLGGNGLVANAAKYVGGAPILGVNADPGRQGGVLARIAADRVAGVLPGILEGRFAVEAVTMAEARLSDGQRLLGFNDLFIGRTDHVSARYRIEFGGQAEEHSSCGIIASTGAGSTGWLRSVVAGSLGVARALGVAHVDRGAVDPAFPWAAEHLLFAVREPWPSPATGAGLVFGRVDRRHPLRVVSRMAERGVIFSDGVAEDALPFHSGTTALVVPAPEKANLVVPPR